MSTITIPAGSKITKRTIDKEGKHKGKPITVFVAMHNGEMITPVEFWGDAVTQLTAARDAQTPLEVSGWGLNGEATEPVEQYGKYSIRFKGIGGGFGGKGGWQQRPYVPAGYKGQPMPLSVWLDTTGKVLSAAAILVRDAQLMAIPPPMGDVATINRDAMMVEARALAAQYWICVEKGITYPAGYEPKGDSVPSTAGAATTTKKTEAKQQKPDADTLPNPEEAAMEEAWRYSITSSATLEDVEAVMKDIREQVKDKVAQARLLSEAFKQKRKLSLPPQREPGDE